MTIWIIAVVLCFVFPVLVLLRHLWNIRILRLSEERCRRLKDDYKVRSAQVGELRTEIRQLQMSGRGVRK